MREYLENDRYVTRLCDKLILLDTEHKLDFAQIDKAIYWAIKYHAGQYRQSGEPYYSHPLEVAYMVADYLLRTDIIITAILHDTIEDTSLTAEMIETAFGGKIAGQVEDLTRIKPGGKISSAELVDSLWLQKKYDVLLVKQFDSCLLYTSPSPRDA
jgi:(p)ppGpp synthase/HD superfamily hydrolase